MKVLDVKFTTIRAAVAVVAGEIKKTSTETRIVFGPGFQQQDFMGKPWDVTIKKPLVPDGSGVFLFTGIENLM